MLASCMAFPKVVNFEVSTVFFNAVVIKLTKNFFFPPY